uniref:Uncharacterized protein n=1 Tax=Sphaerodactylus townsendi TaxID=933632 RepID=A0ACB8F230_9SAUR
MHHDFLHTDWRQTVESLHESQEEFLQLCRNFVGGLCRELILMNSISKPFWTLECAFSFNSRTADLSHLENLGFGSGHRSHYQHFEISEDSVMCIWGYIGVDHTPCILHPNHNPRLLNFSSTVNVFELGNIPDLHLYSRQAEDDGRIE